MTDRTCDSEDLIEEVHRLASSLNAKGLVMANMDQEVHPSLIEIEQTDIDKFYNELSSTSSSNSSSERRSNNSELSQDEESRFVSKDGLDCDIQEETDSSAPSSMSQGTPIVNNFSSTRYYDDEIALPDSIESDIGTYGDSFGGTRSFSLRVREKALEYTGISQKVPAAPPVGYAGKAPDRTSYYENRKADCRMKWLIAAVFLLFAGLFCGFIIILVKELKTDSSKSTPVVPTTFDYISTSVPVENDVSDSVTVDGIFSSPGQDEDQIIGSLRDKFGESQDTDTQPCTIVYPTPPPLPGKKGVAMTLRDQGEEGSWVENLPKVIQLNPHWNYNWGLKRIDAQPNDIEFVPMVWDGAEADQLGQNLEQYVLPHVQSGKVKRLLGFNEPDKSEQANLTVQRALDIWPKLENLDLPLVSPSGAMTDGEWMDNFISNATVYCQRVDWIGVHWYGSVKFDAFVERMTEYHEKYQKPLLLTEFAPVDWESTHYYDTSQSPGEVLAFMKQALPWLEQQEWIAGYAWFPFNITHPKGSSAALFDEDGALTACGQYYASVRSDNPSGDQSIKPDYRLPFSTR